MEEEIAIRLVAFAHLREQPSVVLELLSAYKQATQDDGFWRGYITALEWSLRIGSHPSLYVDPDKRFKGQ